MQRRHFLGVTASTLAGSVLSGCVPHRAREGRLPNDAGTSDPLNAAAFHATRQYAETRFGKISYVEQGSGDAALFLHGFPLNSFQWRGALERLSAHRRCVAPDFLGMGYTDVADGQGVAPDDQMAMLVTLLDTLSISTVDLVANDSGGAVAQLLVTRHPERVRTLLLTNCDTEHDSPPAAVLPVIEQSKAGLFVDQTLAPQLADKALARSAEGIGGLCYSDTAHPTDEAIDYYFGPLLSTSQKKAQAHAYAIALAPNPLAGIEPALRRCTVPTRIVWGMADTIFLPENPDYLDRVIGSSLGVRRLEGHKLFWPEVRPDVIAEEARRLWAMG
ncbi:MAG TPA: alpha/beta fold hydrolase [Rhodothermales bacterium]|nr:alpha/beta fold hydrolase [Rhodothermales bacterium]